MSRNNASAASPDQFLQFINTNAGIFRRLSEICNEIRRSRRPISTGTAREIINKEFNTQPGKQWSYRQTTDLLESGPTLGFPLIKIPTPSGHPKWGLSNANPPATEQEDPLEKEILAEITRQIVLDKARKDPAPAAMDEDDAKN
jgi:hypothetical protein